MTNIEKYLIKHGFNHSHANEGFYIKDGFIAVQVYPIREVWILTMKTSMYYSYNTDEAMEQKQRRDESLLDEGYRILKELNSLENLWEE